ncbi:DUF1800 domain-containing protein [Burkholderiaceae bacterium DAT-1]|nr:DUF1800 domain-containing protein [Burkholderiaceae bacterium DAT-1]
MSAKRKWVSAIAAIACALPAACATLTSQEASRFLEQASFGPTTQSVADVQRLGVGGWLDQQFATPATGYAGFSYMDPSSSVGCPKDTAPPTCHRDHYTLYHLQRRFFMNALTGPDQLRQRVALALSQIMVTSGVRINQPYAMAAYQQILLNDAFGNFSTLLKDVSLSPAMGRYLDMVNNDKANPAKGTAANENYARELMQLFSLGLVQLNADGSIKKDSAGNPLASYTQEQIEETANALTGWTFPARPGAAPKWTDPAYYLGQMVAIESHHDVTRKTIVSDTVIPAGQAAANDVEGVIAAISRHPNAGPFIGRQLIQHLVTSNPSPAYVARVTAVFNNNGNGVRGDLKAVISTILTDPEARNQPTLVAEYGRLREPVLYQLALMRALGGTSDGVYLRGQAAVMLQDIFNSPTVFSFYPPDYLLPGNKSLQGPPFAIYNASSSVARSNFTIGILNKNGIAADASVPDSIGTKIDYATWLPLAATPTALVDKIDATLFHGTMSADLRTLILNAVNGVKASDSFNRVRSALYLAAMSPQFQIQR